MKRAGIRENFAQNRNSEIGHREVVKTPENIMLKKRKLWVKTYTPRNRSLVEFKDVMIKGLNDEELKETCIFFMPENCTTAGNRDRCNVRSPTIL